MAKPPAQIESLALSETGWQEWLLGVLNGSTSVPSISTSHSDPLHVILGRLFTQLPRANDQVLLAKAVQAVFSATPVTPQYAEQLFTLLNLMVVTRAAGCFDVLRRYVLDEVLNGMEFAEQNLHYLAVAVLAEFGVTDELAEYVWRTSASGRDWRFTLLTLHVLAARSAEETLRYLQHQLRRGVLRPDMVQSGGTLRDLFLRIGYRPFYEWRVTAKERMSSKDVTQFDSVVRTALDLDEAALEGGFALLLAAEVWADVKDFTPQELVEVASAAGAAGDDNAMRTLATLGSIAIDRGQSLWWLGGGHDFDLSRAVKRAPSTVFLRARGEQVSMPEQSNEALLLSRVCTATFAAKEVIWG